MNLFKGYWKFYNSVIPYLIGVSVLIGIIGYTYTYFDLYKLHTQPVEIYCSTENDNIALKNSKSIFALKLYLNDSSKFSGLKKFKKDRFFKDTIHVNSCLTGYMYPKDWYGAKEVEIETKSGNLRIFLLEEFITKK